MKLYYLGPPATFTEEAADEFCSAIGAQNVERIPCRSIREVIDAVAGSSALGVNNSVFGCIPLENSIQGSVTSTWDTLGRFGQAAFAGQSDALVDSADASSRLPLVQIRAAVTLPIRHYLLTLQGTALSDIDEVFSHPQALAQCTDWTRQTLPNARQTTTESTAAAAKIVATQDDKKKSAIGTRRAAEVYGLTSSKEPIQNSQTNETRFGLITASREPLALAYRMEGACARTLSVVLVGVANSPGGLLMALTPFYSYGFNLTRIESRPEGRKLGEYLFYIDVAWPVNSDALGDNDNWREVSASLAKQSILVVVLGLYPLIAIDTETRTP